MATANSNQISLTPVASTVVVPPQPPNEGSTQFVYQINSTFYLVDYAANQLSVWNPTSQTWIKMVGASVNRFMINYKSAATYNWFVGLVASNPQGNISDYFSNVDATLTAVSSPGRINI